MSEAWIELRLINLGKSQVNGMVESFNGSISDVLATRRYDSSENLEQILEHYCCLYNYHLPQKAFHHKVSIAVIKEW